MKFKLLFFLAFSISVCGINAQNLVSDTLQTVQTTTQKTYRLDADTVLQVTTNASRLLRGNDVFEKTKFLSNLRIRLKSSATEDWRLDSIVTTAWNEQQHEIEPSLWQVFNTQEEKVQFEIRNYKMDTDAGHWIIDEAQYYHFNDQEQLDSVEFQTHVTLNYILYSKFLYTYENGRLKAEVSLEKFDEFDDWKYLTRLAYEYDSLGRLERVYTQEIDPFNNNLWKSFQYVQYAYDSVGNMTTETYYDYDDYEMVSTKTSELLYEYDGYMRLIKIVEFVEGWQTGTFVEEAKVEFSYDEAGRLVQQLISHWDYDTDDWVGFARNTRQYNKGADTMLVAESENWDNGWILKNKSVYKAPLSIKKDHVQSSGFVFSFLPMYEQEGTVCEEISRFGWDGSDWQESGTTSFYFRRIWPVDVPLVSTSDIQWFPNPVSDYLKIASGINGSFEIRIMDLNGRLLLQKTISEKNQLNVQILSPGFYLFDILQDGKKIFSDKFIKK